MKNGFTLIELIVSIAILGILLIGASSLLTSVIASRNRNQEVDRVEQVRNDLAAELTDAIRWSDFVSWSEKKFSVKIGTAETVYNFSSGRIYKNGKTISPETVSIKDVEIKNVGIDNEMPLLRLTFTISDKKTPNVMLPIRIVVAKRVHEKAY